MNYSKLFTVHVWLLLLAIPLLLGLSVYYLVAIIPQLSNAFTLFSANPGCGCEQVISFTHHPWLTSLLSLLAIVALSIIIGIAVSLWKQYRATQRYLAQFSIHSEYQITLEGKSYTVRTIDSEQIHIFAAGILHPIIYISQTALELLSAEEQRSVITHEIGHIQRHDVLKRLCTNALLSTFSWIPSVHRLQESIEFTQEQLADQFSAQRNSRTIVLSALMKLIQGNVATPSNVVPAFVVNEARVEHLLMERVRFPLKMTLGIFISGIILLSSVTAVFASGYKVLDYIEPNNLPLSAATCVEQHLSYPTRVPNQSLNSAEFCAQAIQKNAEMMEYNVPLTPNRK